MIHGYKAVYKEGESVTLILESGNYLVDFSSL